MLILCNVDKVCFTAAAGCNKVVMCEIKTLTPITSKYNITNQRGICQFRRIKKMQHNIFTYFVENTFSSSSYLSLHAIDQNTRLVIQCM